MSLYRVVTTNQEATARFIERRVLELIHERVRKTRYRKKLNYYSRLEGRGAVAEPRPYEGGEGLEVRYLRRQHSPHFTYVQVCVGVKRDYKAAQLRHEVGHPCRKQPEGAMKQLYFRWTPYAQVNTPLEEVIAPCFMVDVNLAHPDASLRAMRAALYTERDYARYPEVGLTKILRELSEGSTGEDLVMIMAGDEKETVETRDGLARTGLLPGKAFFEDSLVVPAGVLTKELRRGIGAMLTESGLTLNCFVK